MASQSLPPVKLGDGKGWRWEAWPLGRVSVCVTQKIVPQQGLGENVASNLSATRRFELEQTQGMPELYDLLGLVDASQINEGCLQRKTVYHTFSGSGFSTIWRKTTLLSHRTPCKLFVAKEFLSHCKPSGLPLKTLGITFKVPLSKVICLTPMQMYASM